MSAFGVLCALGAVYCPMLAMHIPKNYFVITCYQKFIILCLLL